MNWNRSTPTEQPEPGSHVARCISIIDLGTQQHSYGGETWSSRDVRIGFELPEQLMKGLYRPELKGKPFVISLTLKQSLHSASKMRRILKSWRGRDFTMQEVVAFKPHRLLGKPCRLTIVQSQDGQFANIDSVAPIGKDEKCPKQVNPSTYLSLDPGEFNASVLATLGDKTREKIIGSPEYNALFTAEHDGQTNLPPEDISDDADADGDKPF